MKVSREMEERILASSTIGPIKPLVDFAELGKMPRKRVKKPVQQTILPPRTDLKTWSYSLPWPPSVNSYKSPFVVAAKGPGIPVRGTKVKVMLRMVLSARGREFKELVDEIVFVTTRRPKTPQRLAVTIKAFGPDRRAFDIDNRIKPTLDALQEAGAFVNDEQIDELSIVRKEVVGRERARVEVTITELS